MLIVSYYADSLTEVWSTCLDILNVQHSLPAIKATLIIICLSNSLQQSTFSRYSDVRQYHAINPNTPLPPHIRFQSENKQDVGSLFRGFFEYYGMHFNFSNKVVSVRTGKVLLLSQVDKNGGDWRNKYIHIEGESASHIKWYL